MDFTVMFMVVLMFSTVKCNDHNENQSNTGTDNPNDNSLPLPPIQLDPKLRRALLRVLNKLEEEDKTNTQDDTSKEQNPSANTVTEEDFVKYFSNKKTQEQLFGPSHPPGEPEEDDEIKIDPHYKRAPGEDIKFSLYQTSDDDRPDARTATYPREIAQAAIEEIKEPVASDFSYNNEKYPSTNPTPQDTVYFQVPHPIVVPDSVPEKLSNGSFNEQETNYFETVQASESTNNQKEENHKTVVESVKSSSDNDDIVDDDDLENSDEDGKSGNSTKNLKHEVEFLHAPLLAAFTVQQDQQGLPRRVIPLNYKHTEEPIPLPHIDPEEELRRTKELEEKKRLLDEQLFQHQRRLKLLQLQQLQQNSVIKNQDEISQFNFQNDKPQQQFFEDDQLRNQQEQFILQQRKQQLLENQQKAKQHLLLLEQNKLRQQQNFLLTSQTQEEQQRLNLIKEQERLNLLQQQQQQQNQPQNQHLQTQPLPQNFQFQKSVDFQFRPSQPLAPNPLHPTTLNNFNSFPQPINNFNNFQPSPPVELNRVNRGESNRFVGNFGFNSIQPVSKPPTPDRQLQNLLFQSGVQTNDLPTAQEDLNIVTKVLSLNHETQQQHVLQQQQQQLIQQQQQQQQIQQFRSIEPQQHFRQNNQQFQLQDQKFRSNDQQFRTNAQQFRQNTQQFRPNNQQYRSNEQFRPNVQQFRGNDQIFPLQQFRPTEQIVGEPSLKINKIVKAPSLVIEPPKP